MATLLYNWRLSDDRSVANLAKNHEIAGKVGIHPAPILFEGQVQDDRSLADGTRILMSGAVSRHGGIVHTLGSDILLGGPAPDYAKNNPDARERVLALIPDLSQA
jgi:hypothetical protein